jgi:hypothetical protein
MTPGLIHILYKRLPDPRVVGDVVVPGNVHIRKVVGLLFFDFFKPDGGFPVLVPVGRGSVENCAPPVVFVIVF